MTMPAILRYLLRIGPIRTALHCLDALWDFVQFERFSASLHGLPRDKSKLEALLFFHYHKIEKALALAEIPELPGDEHIGKLLDLMDCWAHTTKDLGAVPFRGACKALLAYVQHSGDHLHQSYPMLAARVESTLARYELQDDSEVDGGTHQLLRTDLDSGIRNIDFGRFIRSRHSVRNFTKQRVPDDLIVNAVQHAQRTPSVCNRQSWRVHVYTDPADKSRVLSRQNGNEGFGHLADRILLVTSDTRTFLRSAERHQAFIDGGMFAMNLLLALHSQGIASCCLNVSNHWFQEIALRRVCRIPKHEIPIVMIAIGYQPEKVRIAASARKPTESMLSFRTLSDA